MITITLEKIESHNPCQSGWEKLLASKGGDNADMSAEFPVTDILTSNDLHDALWALRCLPEHSNLWRKYAVWCARQVQHLMKGQRSINALDVAWRHSDGMATDEELAAAWAAARATAMAAAGDAAMAAAGDAARAAAWVAAWAAAMDAAMAAAWVARAAAMAAAGDAARAAAMDAAMAAAWVAASDAQKEKLVQILTAGVWIDDDLAGKGGEV